MRTISSGKTFFVKRVFPAFWFGFLAIFSVTFALNGAAKDASFLIGPIAMVIFGFLLMRKFVWDLADEVRDGGDYLLVRRGSIEEKVPLTNVMNVNMSQFSNPPRLSLRLRKVGPLGDEIVFIPQCKARLNPFARNELAEQLMHRIDRLRVSRDDR